jgi:hypothetical protein
VPDAGAAKRPLTVIALGWAGMLPFAALALAMWVPAVSGDDTARLFLVYALAITGFLSGTIWGQASGAGGTDKVARLCASNALVLVGAFALAFASTALAAWIFLFLFWAILAFEWRSADRRGWYLRYRLQLTIAVSVCHLVLILALD